MSNRYALGDSPGAAQRLARLAELFAPTSRAFIARTVTCPPRLVLDLGCGTGHTTRLLAETTGAAETVGLDRSRAFLDLARAHPRRAHPRRAQAIANITFIEHDVGTVPFPVGQADVIYARYLLSHFPNPEAVVARWLTQLAPGGVLLLEDNETITTVEPAFRDYLAWAAALIREHGGELEVGARLARLAGGTSAVVSFCPTNADTAQLFLMNLDAQGYEGPLRAGLLPLATQADRRGVQWRLRQVLLTRA